MSFPNRSGICFLCGRKLGYYATKASNKKLNKIICFEKGCWNIELLISIFGYSSYNENFTNEFLADWDIYSDG